MASHGATYFQASSFLHRSHPAAQNRAASGGLCRQAANALILCGLISPASSNSSPAGSPRLPETDARTAPACDAASPPVQWMLNVWLAETVVADQADLDRKPLSLRLRDLESAPRAATASTPYPPGMRRDLQVARPVCGTPGLENPHRRRRVLSRREEADFVEPCAVPGPAGLVGGAGVNPERQAVGLAGRPILRGRRVEVVLHLGREIERLVVVGEPADGAVAVEDAARSLRQLLPKAQAGSARRDARPGARFPGGRRKAHVKTLAEQVHGAAGLDRCAGIHQT